MNARYPKRLIEVDLPIKRISAHARREKSIRHGHISTLHIWWARRPLAACRAVICAALWPDPVDTLCPQVFRDRASKAINAFAHAAATDRGLGESCDHDTWVKWQALVKTGGLDANKEAHWNLLRFAMLDFIADFANWDNSTVQEYLETSRALTQAAHESLGGEAGTRPLVVDPFAGGGSIPLEVSRIGADAFASDLNPIPALLNKVLLEYAPRYGQRLINEVSRCGEWLKQEAEKQLSPFYPVDPDGSIPIAYLWARTVRCEGPCCGAEVPLIRSLWLAKKSNRSFAVQLVPNPSAKRVDFRIVAKRGGRWVDEDDPGQPVEPTTFAGTVKSGSATCPCCGYTTPVAAVRAQLKQRRGGTNDSRMFCVVTTRSDSSGRSYRLPNRNDLQTVSAASATLRERNRNHDGVSLSLPPTEPIPKGASRESGGSPFTVFIYGIEQWGDLFAPRQLLSLTTLSELVRNVDIKLGSDEDGLKHAVRACLAIIVDKLADKSSSLCRWKSSAEYMAGNTFSRQALPMVLDFCEANLFGGVTGDIASETMLS